MTREQPPDERLALLHSWLQQLPHRLELQPQTLRPASSDASFRRYFRIDTGAAPVSAAVSSFGSSITDPDVGSFIVMDAPPAHEDCRPFLHLAGLLARQGVSTPQLIASDLDLGFLLLSDFGSITYADAMLHEGTDVAALYADALAALLRLQQARPGTSVPAYDRGRLLAEMRLFPEWYVAQHLGMELTARERGVLDATFDMLVDAAVAQSQVLVHRDYHCRNLMVLDPRERNPGVLDFQDAVLGPITYDLVSLLRDAYVEWPEARQLDWAARYWELARQAGLPVPEKFDVFWRDLEWMGLQRGLKVLGIFARLYHRDGKSRYLADLPLVLKHTQRAAERYDAFSGLARLLERVHQHSPLTGYTF